MNINLIHISINREKSALSIKKKLEKNEFTYGKLLLGHPVVLIPVLKNLTEKSNIF